MTKDDDLRLALRLAVRAADIAMAHTGRTVERDVKPDGSPVTAVDLAIEKDLMGVLRSERPDDAITSEESGSFGDGERRWLLDPLDGTSMFIDGERGWGTLIALQVGGETQVAVITRPLNGLCWWAVRGWGAFRGDIAGEVSTGHAVRMSDVASLDAARITAWGDPTSPEIPAVLSRLPGWIEPGVDSFIRLMAGELDAIVSLGGSVWDHAPTVLIVEEARGEFRDPEGGKRIDLMGGVYSNAHLAEPIGNVLGWY